MLNCDDRCNFFSRGGHCFWNLYALCLTPVESGFAPWERPPQQQVGLEWWRGGERGWGGYWISTSSVLRILIAWIETLPNLNSRGGCITQNIKVLVKSKKCNAICVKKNSAKESIVFIRLQSASKGFVGKKRDRKVCCWSWGSYWIYLFTKATML